MTNSTVVIYDENTPNGLSEMAADLAKLREERDALRLALREVLGTLADDNFDLGVIERARNLLESTGG